MNGAAPIWRMPARRIRLASLQTSRSTPRRLNSNLTETHPSESLPSQTTSPKPYPPPIPTYTPPTASRPAPSTLRVLAARTRTTTSFLYRARKTLFELFLWMVAGSLALELRFVKRDMDEFEQIVDVKTRKLEREREELLRRLRGEPLEIPKQKQSTPTPLPSTTTSAAKNSDKPRRVIV